MVYSGMCKIPVHKIERYSGAEKLAVKAVKTISDKNYYVNTEINASGDAPKAIIGLYTYKKENRFHRNNKKAWDIYIAKTGQKWYPIESITEHLLNRLGTIFGLEMAESDLVVINGQLRFISKWFLKKNKSLLVHGAEIFAGYLEDDQNFVEQIEEENLSRDLFTLQFVEKAVGMRFPSQKEEIMYNLVKLLLFDAFVGNNDRHFYNWGVVCSIDNKFEPYFSPVYDTARGLYWNESESQLKNRLNNRKERLGKYIRLSRPKLGWEGEKGINHVKLVSKIYDNEFYISRKEIEQLISREVADKMISVVSREYPSLLSANRISFINECLNARYELLKSVLK